MEKKTLIALLFLMADICCAQKLLDNQFDVAVSDADSIHIPPRWKDNAKRDSIMSIYGSGSRYRDLENYLLGIENPGITRIPENVSYVDAIKIKLSNGRTLTLKRNHEILEISDFIFVEYFKELKFLLFRVEWTEGFHYLLIDLIDGKQTNLIGLPYFSPDKKFMVAINYGSPDEWVENGFELYKAVGREFKKIWEYDPKIWAPMELIWISNNTLISKNETDFGGVLSYKRLTIYLAKK